jgi:lipopolysaccharide/colanic/teichoic acid biosynthesis glycosyltransferase
MTTAEPRRHPAGLTLGQRVIKRSFDLGMAFAGLLVVGPLIMCCWIGASINTRSNGFFLQERIGKNGRPFKIIKIKTMRPLAHLDTTVTTHHDPRITALGHFFRKTKLDELPQLVNIIMGQMSFVGPRPDAPGYADQLVGEDRIILTVRPGITGPASLYFRDEEILLGQQSDPEHYNNKVLYPHKVELNKLYVENYSFCADLRYIRQTLSGRRMDA